jgi:hypothetical protein
MPACTTKIPIHTKDNGMVMVNNFLARLSDTQEDVTLREEKTYTILFYAKDQSFFIGLKDKDLVTARKEGEAALLDTLDISKEDACKLRVSLTVPFSVSENAAGVDYGLSFCPNGRSLPKDA